MDQNSTHTGTHHSNSFFKKNKTLLLMCGGLILLLGILSMVFLLVPKAPPPSTEITYTDTGFTPSSVKLLVDSKGTSVLFINSSGSELDISESSSNPEVFQIGIVESGNEKSPKKAVLKQAGLYTFTNTKNPEQKVVIDVITTDQLQQQ